MPPVEVAAAILPFAVERDCSDGVVGAHGTEFVRHLKVALLLGFAQTLDFARDDEVVVGAELETVLLGKTLGAASPTKYTCGTVGEDLLGSAR